MAVGGYVKKWTQMSSAKRCFRERREWILFGAGHNNLFIGSSACTTTTTTNNRAENLTENWGQKTTITYNWSIASTVFPRLMKEIGTPKKARIQRFAFKRPQGWPWIRGWVSKKANAWLQVQKITGKRPHIVN